MVKSHQKLSASFKIVSLVFRGPQKKKINERKKREQIAKMFFNDFRNRMRWAGGRSNYDAANDCELVLFWEREEREVWYSLPHSTRQLVYWATTINGKNCHSNGQITILSCLFALALNFVELVRKNENCAAAVAAAVKRGNNARLDWHLNALAASSIACYN